MTVSLPYTRSRLSLAHLIERYTSINARTSPYWLNVALSMFTAAASLAYLCPFLPLNEQL